MLRYLVAITTPVTVIKALANGEDVIILSVPLSTVAET